MSYTIIIPARFASTRFPGKPLALLAGKPMLQHVYERACESKARQVVIATDDQRIEAAAVAFGAEVCMTSADHESGTDRLSEAVGRLGLRGDEIVVNLQGDEPFMPPGHLDHVADLLCKGEHCGMSTLCHRITDPQDISNPNVVKVVIDQLGYALYFSRAPIPWNRDNVEETTCYRHMGLYGYTAGFLRHYHRMSPCEPEKLESLEQLRVLWHGERIKVGIAETDCGIGIDTPEDLIKAEGMVGCVI